MGSTGKALPWYGLIQTSKNPEAAAIWRSRNEEPELCEPAWLSDHYVTDLSRESEIELGASIFQLIEQVCSPKERKVIAFRFVFGMTLAETADAFGVTGERIRQIENKAFRRIRESARKLR